MKNKYKLFYRIIIFIFGLLIINGALPVPFLCPLGYRVAVQAQELSREEIFRKSREHFHEGERLYNENDYSRADQEFKKAQELLERLKQEETVVAGKKAKKGSLNKTRELKAAKYERAKANVHYNLAIEYLKTSQFLQAAGELNKAVQLNPEDKDAYYNLGVLHENYLGDIWQAKFYYTRYIKLAPRATDTNDVKKWIRRIDKEID